MKAPPRVLEALDATGLAYSFEQGGQHLKIKLANRLVGILPYGKGRDDRRTELNIVSQIRRQGALLNGQA